MTKRNEIARKVKHSNRTSTLFHETENLLKVADPQQAPQIILQLLQQLGDKLELHVHFVVNSVVVGNNVSNSNINLTGHITRGDNSSIDGSISVDI